MAVTAPGPRGLPFVGDLLAYEADRVGWLVGNRDRYGDVVRLAPKMVAVHDPALAHQVLAGTDRLYAVDPLLRATSRDRRALDAYHDEWMRTRRDVWKSVSDRLTQLHLERFVDRLDADLARLAGPAGDVLVVCRRLLGRAIVDFCVGGGTDRAEPDALYDAADALFHTALTALVGGEGRAWWARRPSARAAVAANDRLLSRLGEVVAGRRAARRPAEPRDLLDALLTADGTDQSVVALLRTIMFASHGVPGTALAWVALALAEHPAAAASAAGDPAFTRAFVQEVLRLHPPQWLITRTAVRPTTIGAARVPAGTEVLVCALLMHRDPRWWTDPMDFRPQRWLGRDQPHARHAYLPFGAGPRICPGSHLALTHLTAVTGLLARDYEVRLPAPESVPATYEGLYAPTGLRGGWWRRPVGVS